MFQLREEFEGIIEQVHNLKTFPPSLNGILSFCSHALPRLMSTLPVSLFPIKCAEEISNHRGVILIFSLETHS